MLTLPMPFSFLPNTDRKTMTAVRKFVAQFRQSLNQSRLYVGKDESKLTILDLLVLLLEMSGPAQRSAA